MNEFVREVEELLDTIDKELLSIREMYHKKHWANPNDDEDEPQLFVLHYLNRALEEIRQI